MKQDRPYPGLLITFEGPEGSGKTTQVNRLAGQLNDEGLPVSFYREPGSTQVGNEIRAIVLENMGSNIKEKTEVLLFQASRAQLMEERIIPDLLEGKIVCVDRHRDSSIAYQGYAAGMGASEIDRLNNYSTGGLIPDLTIFIDVEPEKGLERRRKNQVFGEAWNRLDDKELEYHKRVYHAYRTLYAYDQEDRWVRIDGSNRIERVALDIQTVIYRELRNYGFIEGQRPSPERRG